MSVLVSREMCQYLGLRGGTYDESGCTTVRDIELFGRVVQLVNQLKNPPMTYDQKKVDELVSNAQVLESLRDWVVRQEKLNSFDPRPLGCGHRSSLGDVRDEIDKRTVTLMERIYAELVLDEVPFEED